MKGRKRRGAGLQGGEVLGEPPGRAAAPASGAFSAPWSLWLRRKLRLLRLLPVVTGVADLLLVFIRAVSEESIRTWF